MEAQSDDTIRSPLMRIVKAESATLAKRRICQYNVKFRQHVTRSWVRRRPVGPPYENVTATSLISLKMGRPTRLRTFKLHQYSLGDQYHYPLNEFLSSAL
jgi:hypothetical protein